jgi:hypothetical protein
MVKLGKLRFTASRHEVRDRNMFLITARANNRCTGVADTGFSWTPRQHGGPVNTAVRRQDQSQVNRLEKNYERKVAHMRYGLVLIFIAAFSSPVESLTQQTREGQLLSVIILALPLSMLRL